MNNIDSIGHIVFILLIIIFFILIRTVTLRSMKSEIYGHTVIRPNHQETDELIFEVGVKIIDIKCVCEAYISVYIGIS